MATVCVSIFRPIGRVFHNTTVKAVHLLTILSLPASGLPGPRILAIAIVNSLWLGLNALNVNIINAPTGP